MVEKRIGSLDNRIDGKTFRRICEQMGIDGSGLEDEKMYDNPVIAALEEMRENPQGFPFAKHGV